MRRASLLRRSWTGVDSGNGMVRFQPLCREAAAVGSFCLQDLLCGFGVDHGDEGWIRHLLMPQRLQWPMI